jgi:hypothetical protein
MLFSFPLMAVIQALSARIGCVTGYGIAQNLRRHYSPWLLRAVVLLLLVANVINLGADLGAMGAALSLLIGGPEHIYTVVFGVVSILLEAFMSYARYAAVLKWVTLSLFAYVAVVFAAHVPWGSALYGTLVPNLVAHSSDSRASPRFANTDIDCAKAEAAPPRNSSNANFENPDKLLKINPFRCGICAFSRSTKAIVNTDQSS